MMPNLELRILKLRMHWKELILDANKRKLFFKDQFQNQYDEFFLQFLLSKIFEIINLINVNLPLTVLEEVNLYESNFNWLDDEMFELVLLHFKLIANNFKDGVVHLFGENLDGSIKFEDDVRVELFLDNFKLHQLYLETAAAKRKNPSQKSDHKYFKRILKLFYQWQMSLNIDLLSNELV